MGQRSRKRGRRTPRPSSAEFTAHYQARAEERNAAVRATLHPLAPGERPWPLLVAIALAALSALLTLVLWLAGVKAGLKNVTVHGVPKVVHTTLGPAVLLYTAAMGACAIGMWRRWFQAVLAFMCVLGIAIVVFSVLLLKASNLLGFLIPPVFIVGGGFLFWKLVRVLSRMQMPRRPAPR